MRRRSPLALAGLLAACATPRPLAPAASTPFGLFALDDEAGLFGVKLGAPGDSVPSPRPLRAADGGASFVESATIPQRLDDAALTSVAFALHDGVVVAIVFEAAADAQPALLRAIEARYGGPSSVDPQGFLWSGGRVSLRWEAGPDGALLLLFDEQLLREHGAKLPRPTL